MAGSLDATFFAFRKREKGGVLLGASVSVAVAMLVLTLAFGAAVIALLGGSEFFTWYAGAMEMAAQGNTDAPPPPPNVGGIFLVVPLEILFIFAVCVLLAAYESSALRWMIRGERSSPLNLHFGSDMWRVYATYWVWFLYFMLTAILFWIVMLIFGWFLVAASVNDQSPAMVGIGTFVFCLAWVFGWTYVATRLAPAAATSVGLGRFAPLQAWTVSSGRFWALFGAFLLLMIIYVIAAVALGGVFFGAMYANMFAGLDWSLAQTDPIAFNRAYEQAALAAMQNQFSNPASIALYIGGQVVMWVVGFAFYLACYGVNARAVQAALEEGKVQAEPQAQGS